MATSVSHQTFRGYSMNPHQTRLDLLKVRQQLQTQFEPNESDNEEILDFLFRVYP